MTTGLGLRERPRAVGRGPAGGSPRGLPQTVVVAGVALLPVLNPKGPLNMAPVDLVLGAGILVVAVWAGTERLAVHVPYAVPVAGLMVAGLTAALVGDAPVAGFAAVVQEAFLLAWCAAVVCVGRTPGGLATILRAWCVSAMVWAVALVVLVSAGHPEVPGGKGGAGDRARLWFDHPNLAGNYFMVALFVVVATRYPRRTAARVASIGVLLVAMLLAGSNAALLCLPIGVLVIVALRTHARRGPVAALAVSIALLLGGGAVWSTVVQPAVDSLQSTDNGLLRYSVARSSRSAEGRESLFVASYELYRERDVVGIGPSATRRALDEADIYDAKEAHNDYLATLVERGPLGVLSLLALVGTVVVRLVGTLRLHPAWSSVVPCPEALAAVAVAFAFTALTHEVLHYRHFWTFLAVLGALYLAGREARRGPEAGAGADR